MFTVIVRSCWQLVTPFVIVARYIVVDVGDTGTLKGEVEEVPTIAPVVKLVIVKVGVVIVETFILSIPQLSCEPPELENCIHLNLVLVDIAPSGIGSVTVPQL